jgi:hypothetical protein
MSIGQRHVVTERTEATEKPVIAIAIGTTGMMGWGSTNLVSR